MAGHGGAWKVAFADFMTAMMALFLVLWISSQDQKILIATSQYFQNPFNSPMDNTSGVMPFNSNKSTTSTGTDQGNEKEMEKNKQIEMAFLNSVAADFYRLLHLEENFAQKPIDIQVTADGLRITLFDRAKQPLFLKDTAEFTDWGNHAMQGLAWMIERHRFRVSIDGHTNQSDEPKPEGYSPWDISANRANAARRRIVHYAVEERFIERVTGYAGTRPLPGEPLASDSNERITISLSLTNKPPADTAKPSRPAPSSATAAVPLKTEPSPHTATH